MMHNNISLQVFNIIHWKIKKKYIEYYKNFIFMMHNNISLQVYNITYLKSCWWTNSCIDYPLPKCTNLQFLEKLHSLYFASAHRPF